MTDIIGFGTPGTRGGAIDGWDSVYAEYIFVADRYAKLTGTVDQENIQIYSGWPDNSGSGSTENTIARNGTGEVITLDNFSWTIDALTEVQGFQGDDTRGTTSADWRNHALNNVNIDWNNGDILVRGVDVRQRFGLGSGPLANTITGTFSNMRIQADNCRIIFQLAAFTSAEVINPSIDDFTYANARTDANFPGGQIYTNFASGAAAGNSAPGVLDTQNGNFSGIATSTLQAPTTLITPNLRRLRDGTNTTPSTIFRHSLKSTPIIIVDPTFTFIQESDTSIQTDVGAIVNNLEATRNFYQPFSSSDTRTGQQARPGIFLWFGYRFSLQPQTAAGAAVSGEYWVINRNGNYSTREYQIDGITNDLDYTLASEPGHSGQSAGDGNGFTVVANGMGTDQVLTITEHYERAGTATGELAGALVLNDETDERTIIFHAVGYAPTRLPNHLIRSDHGVLEPIATPVTWLKAALDTSTVTTLNDAGFPLYAWLTEDAIHSFTPLVDVEQPDRIVFVPVNASGNITQAAATPEFINIGGNSFTWDIGMNHMPETGTVSASGGTLSPLNRIEAQNFTFDANGDEITVLHLIVGNIRDLRTGLINDAKAGGTLSGVLLDDNAVIRFNAVDVSGMTIGDKTSLEIYGTHHETGNALTAADFAGGVVGTNVTIRGLPRVETVTLPAHGTQRGYYYTTRTPIATGVEVDIELDSDPIRLESDTNMVFNLSSAGGTGSYRGVAWVLGDIFTVYYKYDNRVAFGDADPDNLGYAGTAFPHTFGSNTRDLAPPTLIPSTQTEQALAPQGYVATSHRFTDYTSALDSDNLPNPVGALAITGRSSNGSLAKFAPQSLGLALLIANDENYFRKFVEVSRADPDNISVAIFTVIGGNAVRWNPAAITLASDELLTDGTDQYRVQQSVANWEYNTTDFNVGEFTLQRTGAQELISFEPGSASLQQVQSAAQTGIDSSNVHMLVEESHNINHFLLDGDGGRFLGIKPRSGSFDPLTRYDT